MMELVKASWPALGGGHDRAEVFRDGSRAFVVVADGAGGSSGASRAADLVVDVVRAAARRRDSTMGPVGISRLLERADSLLLRAPTAGQSTAVVIEIAGGAFWGASVGDSGAWLVYGGRHLDLTARQDRKWRLGTGLARPRSFGPLPLCGTLLVATDGLLECALPERLAAAACAPSLPEAAGRLVDGVRLPGGGLRDDVAFVVCRPERLRDVRLAG